MTTDTQFSVQPASAADIPALVALWADKFALLTQLDPTVRYPADGPARWAARLAAALEDPATFIPVASALSPGGPRTVGYGWARIAEDAFLRPHGFIDYLALDLHQPAHGAARALVAAMRGWLRGQGVGWIAVAAVRRSAVEMAFWQSLGATHDAKGTRAKDMVWIRS